MSESIEQVIDTNAQPVSEQSSEDKFFGVASEIKVAKSSQCSERKGECLTGQAGSM